MVPMGDGPSSDGDFRDADSSIYGSAHGSAHGSSVSTDSYIKGALVIDDRRGASANSYIEVLNCCSDAAQQRLEQRAQQSSASYAAVHVPIIMFMLRCCTMACWRLSSCKSAEDDDAAAQAVQREPQAAQQWRNGVGRRIAATGIEMRHSSSGDSVGQQQRQREPAKQPAAAAAGSDAKHGSGVGLDFGSEDGTSPRLLGAEAVPQGLAR